MTWLLARRFNSSLLSTQHHVLSRLAATRETTVLLAWQMYKSAVDRDELLALRCMSDLTFRC